MSNESIDAALSFWDYTLRFWAIIGPLLAGSISAMWARRNQIDDRKYQDAIQMEKEKRL